MTDIASKARYFSVGGPNLGQFFKGWRRKVGIVMLILACLFSAGLLRSDHVLDRGTVTRQQFAVPSDIVSSQNLLGLHRQ